MIHPVSLPPPLRQQPISITCLINYFNISSLHPYRLQATSPSHKTCEPCVVEMGRGWSDEIYSSLPHTLFSTFLQ